MARLSGERAGIARDAAVVDRAKGLARDWTTSTESVKRLVGEFILLGISGREQYMFRHNLAIADLACYVREEMPEDLSGFLCHAIQETLDEFTSKVTRGR